MRVVNCHQFQILLNSIIPRWHVFYEKYIFFSHLFFFHFFLLYVQFTQKYIILNSRRAFQCIHIIHICVYRRVYRRTMSYLHINNLITMSCRLCTRIEKVKNHIFSLFGSGAAARRFHTKTINAARIFCVCVSVLLLAPVYEYMRLFLFFFVLMKKTCFL